MNILLALLPILGALVVGYLLGKVLPNSINNKLIKGIAPLVWGMLFLLGFEFGEIIFSAKAIGKVLTGAIVFSSLTTLIPMFLLFVILRPKAPKIVSQHKKLDWRAALPAIKESSIALSMVFFGAILFVLQNKMGYALRLFSSGDLLLLLILLVGVDFTQVQLSREWFSREILIVPFIVVIGSLLGALPAAWLTNEALSTSFALSTGFGWFTLSSVLVGEAYGHQYGTMALLTDLFRELFAIVVLYAVGEKYPKVGIGAAAATALDSTLPIVKQTCSSKHIPLALVSGFLLTALAPFFITIFLP
ncbi:lysine exporter LysO family protein [Phocoenobacter skyensis]|uniref:Lysine exporter LysO family protein n=1 Tax=Phocoenobacter skyensis TaxID=97481 RepID=A0A1H7V143_9PAST|nr:lysine exporter LysO family protein [Pasteurella skyensis]MDP8078488.1 lysine exporter LysO family protein [Pasteurella skyensis]MDP8084420.1 lysine exporter LysO family protein [Pasteurella skyensis]MDP8161964.1 lysine exporter LysO family protein [Pasteurella skyensis]MDP8170407.1 lysine exporter LysO family protein [Pasteurella skyensis]MDP8172120.1 lysine exporter LysO family protein [Pasteurella skyensis]